MTFDCNNQRRPLLFSDLFKSHRNIGPEKEQQEITVSSCSSSSTQFSSSCDSSSSGFNTPLCSDLGTSESEDGDFIPELARQMAECMLQEEEDDEENTVASYEASSQAKVDADEGNSQSGDVNSLENGFYSSPVCVDDQTSPKIQVYELKNQPSVNKEGRFYRGRRVRGTKSAQQKQSRKTEQKYLLHGLQSERIKGYSGSGMQAVFLGGSMSRNGSGGTGVFLPPDPTEPKNKSGCSAVLIPSRVLQVLELHFSRYQDSRAPPPSTTGSSPQDELAPSSGTRDGAPPVYGDEIQLPQEWTY